MASGGGTEDDGSVAPIKLKQMSKITLSAILTLIRLVIVLISKGVRLVYSIIDLCDDGIINQSAEKPSWYDSAISVINSLEESARILSTIEDEIVL